MTDREKLVDMIHNVCEGHVENLMQPYGVETLARYLIANGVTVQTTPITYRRLLEIAGKMHCWIFLNIGDEYKAYDECGLTDEENHVLGSRGTYCVETAEPPKEESGGSNAQAAGGREMDMSTCGDCVHCGECSKNEAYCKAFESKEPPKEG